MNKSAMIILTICILPCLSSHGFGQLLSPSPSTSTSPAPSGRLELEIVSPLGKPVLHGEIAVYRLKIWDKPRPHEGFEEIATEAFIDGKYSRALPAGDYRVECLAEGWQGAVEKPVSISPGETRKIAFTLKPGFVIAGRVQDDQGRGLDGAEIHFSSSGGWEVMHYKPREISTGPDGSFRVTTLGEAPYSLTVTCPGYREKRVEDVAAGREDVAVVLKKGYEIRGRLLGDLTGGDSVIVKLKTARGYPEPHRNAAVDSEGRFVIPGLEEKEYDVSIKGGGRKIISDWVRNIKAHPSGQAEEVVIPVQTAASVSGAVVSDRTGRPVPGTRIMLFAEGAERSQEQGYASLDGSFNFALILPGTYDLKVALPCDSYGESRMTRRITLASGQEIKDLTFRLAPGREVSVGGTVSDEKGSPIAGAEIDISARGPSDKRFQRQFARDVRSSESGAFSCPLFVDEETELKVSAEKKGFAAAESEAISLGPDQVSVQGVALVLGSGASLSVEVVDAEGKPLAGAVVKAEPKRAPDSGTMRWYLEKRMTDARGLCRFENLPPYSYEIAVNKRGFAPAEEKIAIAEGETVEDIKIVLSEGRTLRVMVRDETGKPVSGASIEPLVTKGESFSFRVGMVGEHQTGPDGTCLIEDLPRKPIRLSVEAEGYAPLRFRAVEADAVEAEVVLSAAGSITGRVVDQEGNPVAGVNARAWRARRGPLDFSLEDMSLNSQDLGDGRFKISGLRPGLYRLEVKAGDLAKGKIAELEVKPGVVTDAGEIKLAPGATIFGKVGKSSDGGPLQQYVTVRIKGDLYAMSFVSKNSDRFEIKNLPAGTYTLIFQASGHQKKEIPEVSVAAGEKKEIAPVLLEALTDDEKEAKEKEARFIPSLGVSWGRTAGSTLMDGFPVAEVESGSAAEKAGIKTGDTIVKVNGKGFFEDTGTFLKGVFGKPGTRVKLTVKRAGGEKTEEIELVIPEWDYEAMMKKLEEGM